MIKKEAQRMVQLLKDNPSTQAVWLGNRKLTRDDGFYDYEVPFEWLCDECGANMVYVGDSAVACDDGNWWGMGYGVVLHQYTMTMTKKILCMSILIGGQKVICILESLRI